MTPLETFLLKTIGSKGVITYEDLRLEACWSSFAAEMESMERIPNKAAGFISHADDIDDAIQSLMAQNLIQLKDGLWEAI